ncbi:MAG: extracellular solute-binding protein [Actinomycetota bacterium]|nr:extracellular solute-binding protein [Actinomycetota bacterium]
MRRLAPLCAAGLGLAGLLAGTAPTASASGTTLTIWLMTGEISPNVYNAVNKAFEAQHPGVKVNVEIQQWSGITTKIDTALASSNPPDALEIGNTDVPEYAASGGLVDLTSVEKQVKVKGKWFGGLQAPAEVKGHVYAIPLLAGDRVVVYNEQMFKHAGITSTPTTVDQLIADGKKIAKVFKSRKNFSALYFPGQYWYAALPMIWDHGGNIATYKNGKWVAQLTTKASLAGLQEFKTVQNTLSSVPSRTVNTNLPDQDAVFAHGNAAMIIAGSWEPGVIESDNKGLTGHLGEFPFPSYQGGIAPVFLGGSDIAVAKNSPNQKLAEDWVKLMTNNTFQALMYRKDNLIPNNTSLIGLAHNSALMKPYLQAAGNSQGTPSSPGWAIVEGGNEITNLFQSVATAKSNADIRAIAAKADAYFNTVLNETP